ncbi:MAG TPA: ABC transporter permease [Chitinophagaceae bacterium]
MLRNYLKVAWRNLVKNRTFSLINIAGLAIGLACFLLIALYVLNELSYDRFNKKADRIYRINSDILFGGTEQRLPVTSDMMGATLKKDYPQVEQYARIYNSNGSKLIRKGNEFINEDNVAHADSTLFDVFTLPAIAGDTKTALNDPNSVVLTRTAALKYFGTTDVIGRTLETDDDSSTVYKVTAVIKDLPQNSHFRFDFFFSMENADYEWGRFSSHNFHTYLLLQKDADPAEFDRLFTQYTENYILPEVKHMMNITNLKDFEKTGNKLVYSMTPLTKIHLYSDRQFEITASGNIQYVYIFSAIALFILIIACINFMNLTTARSANRAKEVGIRKVLGTEKKRLVLQFLSESTLMSVISLVLALLIAFFVLPLFNDIAAKSLSLRDIFSPLLLPLLIALPFVVGLLAGSYPAFFLSGFRPIEVLKGKLNMGSKSGGLRSVLVVIQFTVSIILIIGTVVVYRQINFIQTKNLGFNKDQVLIINNAYALGAGRNAYKNELSQMPGVVSSTFSSYLPVSNSSRSDNTFSKESVLDSKSGLNMQNWSVDHDYIPTLGMEVIKGRNFSRDFGSDSAAMIINETTAGLLGYDDPVGKKIYAVIGHQTKETIPYTIIGVVKNFHFESLRRNIGPLCMQLRRSTGLASFKVKADKIPGILQQAETKWKAMAPQIPFSYRFLNDSFNSMYSNEMRVGKIALVFSVLAILIACLGLFGLATYMAEQRTKEIGVRKVLGATVGNITAMLSKDFLKLVIISAVVAFPLAWWFMHKWLQDFAFRVNIGWWIFLLAAMIALFIALITVSFQAIKAALANPVKSLRTE